MKKLCIQFLLITSFFIFFTTVISAQSSSPDSSYRSRPRRDINDAERAEMEEKVQRFISMRLVEYLDIDENQSAKLLPLLKESNEMRGKLTRERADLTHSIRNDIENGSVTEKELTKYIEELEKINEAIEDVNEDYLNKSKKILDDRQYLKLMLFEDRLKEDLFRRFELREFRDNNNNVNNR